MAYKSVNRAVPRIEGADKVSGNMRYAADLKFPAALSAKILRTSLPHARIVSIDTSKAAKLRGVRGIITGADVKGVMVGLRMKDMPLLAHDKVRYAGEPVAAVAADTDEIAEEALNLIDVKYEELPFVTDPVEATTAGAPVLHQDPMAYKNAPERDIDLPNVQSYGKWANGDLAAGFQKAARIFEHTFRTPLGFHGYIEPHACTVQIHDDGQVEIWASNKAPFTLRSRFARDVGVEEAKVKVHILPVGGDFGGKTSVVEAPVCYFLAKQTGKAVRMVLEYTEELTAISHRHPAVITLRTGVDSDNKICAMAIKAIFSGGGYAALKANAEVTVQGPRRAASYYRFPAIQVETLCAYTNQVPCTQTRTPGSPQTTFAVESQIDIIARELGLDPVDFRMKNLLNAGDPTPFGQKLQGIVVKETLSKALASVRLEKTQGKERRPWSSRLRAPIRRRQIRRGHHGRGGRQCQRQPRRARCRTGYSHGLPADRQRSARSAARTGQRPGDRHRQLALRFRHRRQQVDQQRRHRRLPSGHRSQRKTCFVSWQQSLAAQARSDCGIKRPF